MLLFDPRNYDPAQLIIQAKRFGISEHSVRKLLGQVIGKGQCQPDVWHKLGIIKKELAFSPLSRIELVDIKKSSVDNFEKVVFRLSDGLLIESVIIPLHKSGKVSLCLSSQVGCAMGCVFCATTLMPTRRNLECWEIIDQYIKCRELVKESGREVTGVVFMGMGEPFLNYSNVISAAKLMSFPTAHAISAKAITISTVGVVDKIYKFTQEAHPFRLSISLGAASDEKRKVLVPIAARSSVKELILAARNYAHSRKTRVNISYVCISGINVSETDAKELGRLIGDTPVRLDLIDVQADNFTPPSEQELKSFRDALRKYLPHPVARRYSGGADIKAACGTLAANLALPQAAPYTHQHL